MKTYDVAIIGAGIQGAGIAQAAAAAGFSVVVIEQDEIAAGTSSRSSKLIHGGLRYLESGQFNLVRKSLKERAMLCKLAPELVKLEPFYIPIYRHTSRRPWQIFTGLSLYAILGGLHRNNRFKKCKKSHVRADKLVEEQLQSVYRYYDGQTNDVLLTRAVMKSATDLGADLYQQTEVMKISRKEGRFDIGVDRKHVHENETHFNLSASMIINATGPWVNRLVETTTFETSRLDVDLVQGTHIILDQAPPSGIYYLEAKDKRAVFVMPYEYQGSKKTMVGTTESQYQGDPGKVVPLKQEIAYLKELYQQYFNVDKECTVLDSFAGLRVLPSDNGTSMFSRPRDTIIHDAAPRMLSIYGGKLTAYRATAKKVVKQIRKQLGKRKLVAHTEQLYLDF